MILIAGAGPGGLAAALALQHAGFAVKVWERAAAPRTAGAGLTLQINAMRMLEALGVGPTLRERGEVLASGEVATHDGRVLQSLAFDRMAERFGQPGIAIHRAELSRTLAEALDPGTLEFDRAVVELSQDAASVRVVDQHGQEATFEAVIGADGIHSAVRHALFGEVALRYAGYTCWRGIASVPPPAAGHTTENWGPGRRFGCVPIAAGTTYWFATENAPPDGTDGEEVGAKMRARFSNFPPHVRAVLDATPDAAILRNDIIDMRPLPRWTDGRATLLGDAAHAMTPNLGQGACQAIEDAVVLAASVREHGIPEGLADYEAIRRPRATKLVVDSFRFGRLGQIENGALRWLRDRLLPLLATDAAVARQLEPLYDVAVPQLHA